MCYLVYSTMVQIGVGDKGKNFVPVIGALPAAIIACILSHPGDMVLTRYFQGNRCTVIESIRSIIKENGLSGLLLGLKARLVHVIGIIWVQLIIYDNVKQALGLPATGH